MARVFNISFPYRGNVYNALVTVKGNDESSSVSLRVEGELIHLHLPHGKLTFPVGEVVNYFAKVRQQQSDAALPITDTISLYLLSGSF